MTAVPLPLGLITVHCFACPHQVTCATPAAAYAAMEAHYAAVHPAMIRRLTRG